MGSSERCRQRGDFAEGGVMGHFRTAAEIGQKIAQQLAFEPFGQPAGTLLGVTGLEPAEQAARGLTDAFAGATDQGLAAAGDAAGDGGFGGQMAGGVPGCLCRRLAHEIAGKVQAREEQRHGNGRPGQRGGMVERLQEPHGPRV
jgi:hypothetical protein